MQQAAGPLWQQLLIVIFGPPVGACLWWLYSRGWAMGIQGARVSDRTKKRQRWEFWVVLCLLYAIGIGIMVYAHFIKH